ncbi:hypothetical protein ACKAV7_008434 [Fusarium commune]
MKDQPSYPGAIPPPPGVTPDLNNPQDAGRTLSLAMLIVCDILVTIFFAARAYVKAWATHNILVEDVTCTIAWNQKVLILLYSATFFLMIHYGEGYHAWEVTPEDYSQVLKWLYANSIIYFPTAYFTKVTLLLLISRVFAVKERVARSIHVFIVMLFVAYLPVQIVKIVICIPIRAYWDPSVDGRCLNQRKIFLFGLALAIFTDFVILLVPIPLTWSLRVSLRKKVKIIALLGAGGVATGMTILRMYKAVKFIDSNDVTADFGSLILTTMAELTIGLICSCFPAVSILIKRKTTTEPSRNSSCSNKNKLNARQDQRDLMYLGTRQDESSRPKGSDISPLRSSSSLNVDVELAILSKHPGQMGRRGEASHSNQCHGIDNHEIDECANSISTDALHERRDSANM